MDSTTIDIIVDLAVRAKEGESHKNNATSYQRWYYEARDERDELKEKVAELEAKIADLEGKLANHDPSNDELAERLKAKFSG